MNTPIKNTSSTLQPQLIKAFEDSVGSSNVLTSKADCLAYSYDNSRQQALPQAVVLPNNANQVETIVKLCHHHKVVITARGRGTGTTGATVPDHGGIVLSFEHMNKIIEIDTDNRLARVEPGVINQTLQDALAEKGFFWPPDPTSASNCTIGGNLAYNSAGPRAVKYGTPRENTLGLKAVSGTGDKFKTGSSTTKGVVGYDLTRLLIGSEGTLAIITEATLKLTPLPEDKKTMQATFNSINAAAKAVSAIMAQPTVPCALEMMDEEAIKMVKDFSDLGLDQEAKAILMIEVDGAKHCLTSSVEDIHKACLVDGLLAFNVAHDQQTIEQLWKTRKSLSPALRNIAPSKINEDVVVPVSNIPDLINGLQKISSKHQILIVNFGHAGNGNIHVNMLINPENPVHKANSDACLEDIFKLVLSLDGTLSGEHGVGLVKRDYIKMELDSTSVALMRGIKQHFDPQNILNPDKTLPLDQ